MPILCSVVFLELYFLSVIVYCRFSSQDAFYKEVSAFPVEDLIHFSVRSLAEGYSTLQEFSQCAVQVSLEYLEAVAKVRFALSVVAEELRSNQVRGREELLQIAYTMCTDLNVNVLDSSGRKDITGPVIYLLKLLVRRYGFPCLKSVSEAHPWVVPEELGRGDNVSLTRVKCYQ